MSNVRTKTPADVKWLANELAAVKGDIDRIDAEVARLRVRRDRLIRIKEALTCVATTQVVSELPLLVPPVHTHGRYRGRGNLRNYLRDALKAAFPAAVPLKVLTDGAVQAFKLEFSSTVELARFADGNVGNALRRLLVQGDVERLHDWVTIPNMPGLWRWKVDAPTLDQLRLASPPARGGADAEGEQPWP